MNLLFDVSPTDDGGKKATKKRGKRSAEIVEEPSFAHVPPSRVVEIPEIIGTIDHTYDCADAACGTQCHDIVREEFGDWYLVCAFCGTGQWAPALKAKRQKQEKPADEIFRLKGGRFPGMTLDEVSKVEDGLACIKWWASGTKSTPALREAAQKWLSENPMDIAESTC